MNDPSTISVAIIGAGISGATCARLLRDRGIACVVFEAHSVPGGLVKCTREHGNLFHRVGGHVFNAKNPKIAAWFWSLFDREAEFGRHDRRAVIWLGDRFVGYPIENHLYELEPDIAANAVNDLLEIHARRPASADTTKGSNFSEFLLDSFGTTLCNNYFLPYNQKIWRTDLSQMPLEWLDGKFPMPSIQNIFLANILRQEETNMVHSSFYYPRDGGSQHIIDRLLRGCDLRVSSAVTSIKVDDKIRIGHESFDAAIYTGDVRHLSGMLDSRADELLALEGLKSNGTTTVLCSCDANAYSWVYVPDPALACHRIIMTGNFARTNNAAELGPGRISCTLEFSGSANHEQIHAAMTALPFNLREIDRNHEPNSYIIQDGVTRTLVADAQRHLNASNIWLCGRFAEWEYYNMDAAIGSALNVVDRLVAKQNSMT